MSMRTNYIVLERDILYFGGTVSYTGNVISNSFGKFVEEAVVSLDGVTCNVYMERYKRGGTGAISHFIDEMDGRAKPYEQIESATRFLQSYNSLMLDDEDYMSFSYVQRVKKLLNTIFQVLLFLNMLFSLYLFAHRGFQFFILLNFFLSLLYIIFSDRIYYHLNNDSFEDFRQRLREYEKE